MPFEVLFKDESKLPMYAADCNEYPALLEQLAWRGHFCCTLNFPNAEQFRHVLQKKNTQPPYHESNSCALSYLDGPAAVITKAEPQTQPLCCTAVANKGMIAFWLCCAELGVG